MKCLGRGLAASGLLYILVLLAGCQPETPPVTNPFATPYTGVVGKGDVTNNDQVQIGDELTVTFSDVSPPIPQFVSQIRSDGSITLIYNKKFQVAWKQTGALEDEIRKAYVPDYFKILTVTIKISPRFYDVSGEVRAVNKYPYLGKTTVLGAITAAGGFTDYARKGKVQVTRASGETFTEDCDAAQRNPKLDREIFPNDKVYVPRRLY
jgi:protein involved in polysaccharide export with SLBB domain